MRCSSLALLLLAVLGCDGRSPPPVTAPASASAVKPKAPQQATEPAAAPAAELAAGASRLPAPARLVALGDLHGDFAATRAALQLAGAID